jgi:hypothetical protein
MPRPLAPPDTTYRLLTLARRQPPGLRLSNLPVPIRHFLVGGRLPRQRDDPVLILGVKQGEPHQTAGVDFLQAFDSIAGGFVGGDVGDSSKGSTGGRWWAETIPASPRDSQTFPRRRCVGSLPGGTSRDRPAPGCHCKRRLPGLDLSPRSRPQPEVALQVGAVHHGPQEFQQQVHVGRRPGRQVRGPHQPGRPGNVADRVAATGRAPVDQHGAARSDQDVPRVEITVAERCPVRQVGKAFAGSLLVGRGRIGGLNSCGDPLSQ